jgi:hypothetical protein
MTCGNCGKKIKDGFFYCNDECKRIHYKLLNQTEVITFSSYIDACKYFEKHKKTLKKYEGVKFTIDKRLTPCKSIKWVNCKICNNPSPSSTARSGYCKSCSQKGLGKKQQGIQISKRYIGPGNPNYINGLSKSNEYSNNSWYKLKRNLNFTNCALTGLDNNIDYHHIIPRWFCKLASIDPYDINNIIGINHSYHKAIHLLQIDVLLLPILYSVYKKDALQLRSHFLNLLELHKVHEFPVEQLQSQCLFRLSRYPGRKKLLRLLPEFLPQFLTPQGCEQEYQE